jgi:TPR repeat protein
MKGIRTYRFRLLMLGIVVMMFLPLILNEGMTFAQVTRSQVNLQFMRAEMLLRKNRTADALSALDVVIEMAPEYPAPYLRKARIYDDLYKKNRDPEALASAIYFYRKYLTLEYDSEKIGEPRTRLRQLEDVMKISHFEDLEEQDGKEELAHQDVAPVVTNDEEAHEAVSKLGGKKAVHKYKTASEDPSSPAYKRPEVVAKPVQKSFEEVRLNPYDGFNFARHYDIELPQTATLSEYIVPDNYDLTGHWVSSNCIEDGREMWNLNFVKSADGNYVISISDQSGIVSESREHKQIQKKALSYMSRVRQMNDLRYVIVNEEAEGKMEGKNIKFMFAIDEEYVRGRNIYKWTRNMISNIAHMLPFVEASDNLNNEPKAVQATTVEYTFECKLVGPDVLECKLGNVRNKVNPNGYMRTRRGQDQKIYLYRASAGYDHFRMPEAPDYQNEIFALNLYTEVEEDADIYASRRYPLALLHQYGIGVKKNEDKAVQMMTQLSTLEGDAKAKAWLANYYFHEAYEKGSSSTFTRRKYLKSSEYWMQSLYRMGDAQWYGIKGDMYIRANSVGLEDDGDWCRSLTPAMVDSAAAYYKQGAYKGDLHSIQRLGHLYLWSTPEKRNLEEAVMWLNQASYAGDANAVLDLGKYYLLKGNYDAYLKHVTRACQMGCPEAFEELSKAYLYDQGISHGVEYNFDKAIEYKKLATQAENDSRIPLLISYGYKIRE